MIGLRIAQEQMMVQDLGPIADAPVAIGDWEPDETGRAQLAAG